jgi:hypothetical protein
MGIFTASGGWQSKHKQTPASVLLYGQFTNLSTISYTTTPIVSEIYWFKLIAFALWRLALHQLWEYQEKKINKWEDGIQKLSKNTFVSPHWKFKDIGKRIPQVFNIVHLSRVSQLGCNLKTRASFAFCFTNVAEWHGDKGLCCSHVLSTCRFLHHIPVVSLMKLCFINSIWICVHSDSNLCPFG